MPDETRRATIFTRETDCVYIVLVQTEQRLLLIDGAYEEKSDAQQRVANLEQGIVADNIDVDIVTLPLRRSVR